MRYAPLLAAAALVVAACQAGTEANTVDVSGRWEWTETLEDRVNGISCADTGTYHISQVGDRFVGTYGQSGVCRTPTGPFSNADSGTVDAGRVVGFTIQFTVTANCQYNGAASGTPPSTLTGHATCVLQDGTRRLTLAGAWKANR